jgi:transposase-like protein
MHLIRVAAVGRWRVPEPRAALDALAASGLSVSAFAEQEGLEQERPYRWRRRFARDRKAEASRGAHGVDGSVASVHHGHYERRPRRFARRRCEL